MKNSKRQISTSSGTAKIAAMFLVTISLSACGVDQPFGMAAGATTGFILEDKLPTDYVAEAITGKDCSYIRRLDDGGPLCRSQDYGQVIEPPIYCYKSLGNVSCYTKPNPYGDGVLPVQ